MLGLGRRIWYISLQIGFWLDSGSGQRLPARLLMSGVVEAEGRIRRGQGKTG